MKRVILVLICLSAVVFSAGRLNPERGVRNFIMTDEAGLPLDDGTYSVEFRVYDKNRDGNLIFSHTTLVESKNGVCDLCYEKIAELEKKGYKEVWVSLKIEYQPENKFRTRIFLEPFK